MRPSEPGDREGDASVGSGADTSGTSAESERSPGSDPSPGSSTGSDRFDRRTAARLVVETIVFAVVARLSALYGRDRSLWVFGARGGAAFVGNAKYLYLHAVAERPGIRPVWLSKDRAVVERLQAEGYEAHHAYSARGAYYNLRAGVVCLTRDHRDVNLACTGGADVAQLWHGIPLKHIGWDAELPGRRWAVRACFRYLQRTVSAFVLTARELSGPFASGLGVDPDRAVVAGYPRTDALVRRVPGESVGGDDAARDRIDRAAAAGPLVFYLPTFRDGAGSGFADHLDLDALERFLAERDAHLAVKPHPKESVEVGERTGQRVIELPPDVDVYPLLRRADVLVTDYSSVAFDYLLADRPVAFYPYDLDRYRGDRGFYFDYGSVTPGPTATEFDELLGALDDVLAGDEFAPERSALRERFFECPAGRASERTARVLEEQFRGGS